MEYLVAILIPLGFFAAVVLVVYFVTLRRHAERMEMIRQGFYPKDNIIKIPGTRSLFWGLILIALGIAGIIYFIVIGKIDDPDNLYLVLAACISGAASLLYYRLSAPQRERAMRLYEQQIAAGDFPSVKAPAGQQLEEQSASQGEPKDFSS